MKVRKVILGTTIAVVGVPLALVLVVIATIWALDRTNGSIVTSGMTREYLLHVPNDYDDAKPAPLVISLHAGATWPAHQKNLTRWNQLADEQGFIVVYPSGTPEFFDVARTWRTWREGPGLERDVRFISELIDALRSKYNIDAARIYANGMSNGGGMAFVLSCALSERIAAVGIVAPAQTLPSDWCAGTRPVPMIAFHGDADPVVPYHGGPLGDPFNPVKPVFVAARDFVANWARRNQCAADPVQSTFAPDVTRLEYPNCAEGAAVVFYTLIGGGHSWPGGKPMPEWRVGLTSNSIDATSEMWGFFREHRLHAAQMPSNQPLHPTTSGSLTAVVVAGERQRQGSFH